MLYEVITKYAADNPEPRATVPDPARAGPPVAALSGIQDQTN